MSKILLVLQLTFKYVCMVIFTAYGNVLDMGNMSTKISIPMLEVLDFLALRTYFKN